MAEVIISPAAAASLDSSSSSSSSNYVEMTNMGDTKMDRYEYPAGTDFQILAELKSMTELSLACEYEVGCFPHTKLKLVENTAELTFNALNITSVDEELTLTDIGVVCDTICRDSKDAAEKAKHELGDKLKLSSTDDRCTSEKFKQFAQDETRKHDMTCWEALYLTFASPESGIFGKYFADWILFLIIASTLSFILETEPVFRIQPADCVCTPSPANNATCAPCEPVSPPAFYYVETICISFFTLEYLVRFLTVWAVREAFIFGFTREYRLPLVTSEAPKRAAGPCRRFLMWVTDPMVVIDFLAIIPFFISLGLEDTGAKVNLSFLRVLRLLRVFRVLKLARYSSGLRTFVQVLIRSRDALTVMVFFILLAMILFGSMVYFAENGTWTVDIDHPEGAYMRNTINQHDIEVTPYLSIASSFWWVIVTVTTVGYGDFYPTSPGGKAVGVLTMLSGVLTLALPITVIASNYANETAAQQAEENLLAINKEKIRRRNLLFSRKKVVKRVKGGMKARQNPDTLRILACLAEVNHQKPWPVYGLLENEVRTLHADRVAAVDEPLAEREMALDRFLTNALTLLRTKNSPSTPENLSLVRKELVEFYCGFQSAV